MNIVGLKLTPIHSSPCWSGCSMEMSLASDRARGGGALSIYTGGGVPQHIQKGGS